MNSQSKCNVKRITSLVMIVLLVFSVLTVGISSIVSGSEQDPVVEFDQKTIEIRHLEEFHNYNSFEGLTQTWVEENMSEEAEDLGFKATLESPEEFEESDIGETGGRPAAPFYAYTAANTDVDELIIDGDTVILYFTAAPDGEDWNLREGDVIEEFTDGRDTAELFRYFQFDETLPPGEWNIEITLISVEYDEEEIRLVDEFEDIGDSFTLTLGALPELTIPEKLEVIAGEGKTFNGEVKNPENGLDFDAVYFDFTVENIDVADIELQYYDENEEEWKQAHLEQDGNNVTGRFGPGDGFPMEAGYNAITEFDVKINKPGDYTAIADLYDVEEEELVGVEEMVDITVDSAEADRYILTVEDIIAGDAPVLEFTEAGDKHGNSLDGDYDVEMKINGTGQTETLTFENGEANHTWNVMEGSGTYTAETEIDGVIETDEFKVELEDAAELEIVDHPEEITAGDSFVLVIEVRDEYGNPVGGEEIEKFVVHSEHDGEIYYRETIMMDEEGRYEAEIDEDLVITSDEEHTITAGANPIESHSVDILVEPSEVAHVRITPEDHDEQQYQIVIFTGDEFFFNAVAYDEYGNTVEDDDSEFYWTNTDENGLFEGKDQTGHFGVNATYEEVSSDTTWVTVVLDEDDVERISDEIVEEILDDYLNETEINEVLEDYITSGDLTTALEPYMTETEINDLLEDYVTFDDLTNALDSYMTSAEINEALEDYITSGDLTTALEPYMTETEINELLEGYVEEEGLTDALEPYLSEAEINDLFEAYITSGDLEDILADYLTEEEVDEVMASLEVSQEEQEDDIAMARNLAIVGIILAILALMIVGVAMRRKKIPQEKTSTFEEETSEEEEGICPTCSAVIPIDSEECPKCGEELESIEELENEVKELEESIGEIGEEGSED